ncbi:curli-like amyloid fiber formation chaperone CsgH [Erythrobacter sp. SD-21]|uniref:curli-like amyloid fiber formation chaperone CsgH n=1 Tax=Erythrobacter sp. SD-21 TaxID=161528 RepID=UPI000153F88D|nr:curli-like amyloid fiber formation chaperone CsgH [Erythrobacter sp. SD-21]EDL48754.1 hypothetical protein ED21_23526 [Erythrobacter sp. SD-21]
MITIASLILLSSVATGEQVVESEQAISMRIEDGDGTIQIEMIAKSPHDQVVDYQIEVIGDSRSRHSGKSKVPAQTETSISQFRVSHSGTWCATAEITEQSGSTYTLTAGDCASLEVK